MIDKEIERQWDKIFCTTGGLSEQEAKMLLWSYKDRYREPWRHYHVWDHIRHGMMEYLKIRHLLDYPEAFFLALICHDSIYTPMSKSNEVDSARLMSAHIGCSKNLNHLKKATKLFIETTVGHEYSGEQKYIHDMKYFLDVDLSILGSKSKDYYKYEGGIYNEYRNDWTGINFPTFARERTEVLNKFLSREKIYFTDHYRQTLEARARENIHGEIDAILSK